LTSQFPALLSGRANTTLNLFAFVGAFGIQWGFGAAVDAHVASGLDQRQAYQHTYAWLLGLQAASFVWYLVAGRLRQSAHST
jgi:hypothetical protein